MKTRKNNLSFKSIFTYCLWTLFSLSLWTNSSAQTFQEIQKINHANPAIIDYFGRTVAISENYALVGTIRRDDYGVAYLYQKDPITGTWVLLKTLQSNDRVRHERFSWTMAITDDYAIISASTKSGHTGAVYIFYKDHGGVNNWGQFKKIQSSDIEGGDTFGVGLAVSNDYLVVGAYREDTGGTSVGAAYIFHKDHGGADNWGEIKKIQAGDGLEWDQFGEEVAIHGENIIVNATGVDTGGENAGAAYIFSKNHGGADNWGLVKKIQSSDIEEKDRFGGSVAISDDYAIVSAEREDVGGEQAGAAYIFYKNEGGANNWGEVKKIQASDKQANAQFGVSMSLSTDHYLLISAPNEGECALGSGAVYLFHKDEGGADNWGEVQRITTSDKEKGDGLGQSYGTAISCSNILLGAWHEDTQVFGSGAAYFFEAGIGGDAEYCSGNESIQLDAGAWTSYLWSTGATSRYISASNGETYTVTITTADGCTEIMETIVDEYSCGAEAGKLTVSSNTLCIGEGFEASITDLIANNGYSQYFLLFTQSSSGSLTLKQSHAIKCTDINEEGNSMEYSDLEPGTYQVCAYNESQHCLPSPSPITGSINNIHDIGSQSGCHEIKCTTVVVADAVVSGSEGTGVIPSTGTGMNLFNAEVCGGIAPYSTDLSSSGGFASVEELPSSNSGCLIYQISYGSGVEWTLSVTDDSGCNSGSVTFSSNDLPSNPLQITDQTITPETCVGDEDGSIVIEVSGGDDNCDDYTYTWSSTNGFSETHTDVVTGSSITDLASGTYNVTVTDCVGASLVETGIYVGRVNGGNNGRSRGRGGCKTAGNQDWSEMGALKATPNPFHTQTTIEFSIEVSSKVWLSIYSIEGRKVAEILQGEDIEGKVLQRWGFDANDLKEGMYVLELQTESGERFFQKLMVSK